MNNRNLTTSLYRLIIALSFTQIFIFKSHSQQQYSNLVIRINYRYLDLDLIDDQSFQKFLLMKF